MSAFICMDCKVNTSDINEYYMVDNEIWRKVNPRKEGMLCIGCLENRLGRILIKSDFPNFPINYGNWAGEKSERLNNRLKLDKLPIIY